MATRSVTVLVVDDEPMVRAVAVDLFDTLGLTVFEANDGKEALELLRGLEDIDVLFTDVRMPGMDGIELARHAQQIRPDVKVVLTSGYMGEVAEAPDLPLVPKPWRQNDFAALLVGLSGLENGSEALMQLGSEPQAQAQVIEARIEGVLGTLKVERGNSRPTNLR